MSEGYWKEWKAPWNHDEPAWEKYKDVGISFCKPYNATTKAFMERAISRQDKISNERGKRMIALFKRKLEEMPDD